jgi:putative tricarboxylic transport membrane protein
LRNRNPHSESVFALVLAALGLFILIASWIIGFGNMRNPGSGLFPFLVGLLIVVQSMTIVLKRKSETDKPLFSSGQLWTLSGMSITFVLWIVVMPYLGYLIATFLTVLAFSKLMRLEGWMKPLVLSAGTTALCYLLFGALLSLDLPQGFLG